MSVVKLDAGLSISSVVESMLPRFSDSQLGLLIHVYMRISDLGYGTDGNTEERKELNVNNDIFLLFVRPSNYTKVFVFVPPIDSDKRFISPFNQDSKTWFMESDSNFCWRDAVDSKLTDYYFKACEKFEGRKISGKPLRPCDLSQFILFGSSPAYVRLLEYNRLNKEADKFSTEGRFHNIVLQKITMNELEMIKYQSKNHLGKQQDFFTGLLIKGSEDHKAFLERRKENSSD